MEFAKSGVAEFYREETKGAKVVMGFSLRSLRLRGSNPKICEHKHNFNNSLRPAVVTA